MGIFIRGKGRLSKHVGIIALLLGTIIFLELSSYVILTVFISSTRIERFDESYALNNEQYMQYMQLPHPYLGWVTREYVAERERLLNHITQRKQDAIYVVALGGSTTAEGSDGYPAYTERYLEERFANHNLSLDVIMFNFGVPGWSSVVSMQNYYLLVKDLHPDFVIIHENINDHNLKATVLHDAVIYYPQISSAERRLLRASRFYKLVKFTYLSLYNIIHYGTEIGPYTPTTFTENYPLNSRISSYLTSKDPHAFPPTFFMRDFIGAELLQSERDYDFDLFLLTENYQTFIDVVHAQNSTLVLTTQYVNFSKRLSDFQPVNSELEVRQQHEFNNRIRELSALNGVPLVDLEDEMERYDPMMLGDGVHFNEDGIQVKGELIGAEIFEVLSSRYHLSEGGSDATGKD